MKSGDYINLQTQIITISKLVEEMDLENFIRAIDEADTIGPIIDPTLWMKGQKNMNKIKQVAIALLQFQKVAKREL